MGILKRPDAKIQAYCKEDYNFLSFRSFLHRKIPGTRLSWGLFFIGLSFFLIFILLEVSR